MDWSEARSAVCDRATESSELQHLWEALHEVDNADAARSLIENARDTAEGMLTMLDEWVETSADDGEDDEPEDPD